MKTALLNEDIYIEKPIDP